jgi:GR25 family glycosyltransferase involved in LPS biosynthesis
LDKQNIKDANTNRVIIQVINLARRPDRLAKIGADLQRAGLAFKTQVAVDGQLEELNPMFVTKGAVGCWKSHVNCMRTLADGHAPYSLILEDDAIIGSDVSVQFLEKMANLMDRNELDILQIGFTEEVRSFRLDSFKIGFLESLINILRNRGVYDSSGYRFVPGDFRVGAFAYIVGARLAEALSSTLTGPPLIPWDDYLSLLASGQQHRGIRIARLVNGVVTHPPQLDSEIANK